MTVDEAHAAMENWGRWAHSDAPRLGYAEPPIFAMWLAKGDARDAGWGDEDPPDATPTTIDERHAEWIDGLLYKLGIRHWLRLRRHYYAGRFVDRLHLDAALRALCDVAGGAK